jgi:hypothetical protein
VKKLERGQPSKKGRRRRKIVVLLSEPAPWLRLKKAIAFCTRHGCCVSLASGARRINFIINITGPLVLECCPPIADALRLPTDHLETTRNTVTLGLRTPAERAACSCVRSP